MWLLFLQIIGKSDSCDIRWDTRKRSFVGLYSHHYEGYFTETTGAQSCPYECHSECWGILKIFQWVETVSPRNTEKSVDNFVQSGIMFRLSLLSWAELTKYFKKIDCFNGDWPTVDIKTYLWWNTKICLKYKKTDSLFL
jgi:hypothetical protein